MMRVASMKLIGVVVVLFEAGGDREDVRIEDDVARIESRPIDEQAVGALADFHLAFDRVGLTALVEGHDDDSGPVTMDEAGLVQEILLAFLQAQRVDDRLSLHALEARFDHGPLRAVDHDREAGDLRLGCNDVQEGRHRGLGVEHPLVHVDVEDVGAAADLVERDLGGFDELAVGDEARESLRAGHVRALADHDEVAVGTDGQRFEAGESG